MSGLCLEVLEVVFITSTIELLERFGWAFTVQVHEIRVCLGGILTNGTVGTSAIFVVELLEGGHSVLSFIII